MYKCNPELFTSHIRYRVCVCGLKREREIDNNVCHQPHSFWLQKFLTVVVNQISVFINLNRVSVSRKELNTIIRLFIN